MLSHSICIHLLLVFSKVVQTIIQSCFQLSSFYHCIGATLSPCPLDHEFQIIALTSVLVFYIVVIAITTSIIAIRFNGYQWQRPPIGSRTNLRVNKLHIQKANYLIDRIRSTLLVASMLPKRTD